MMRNWMLSAVAGLSLLTSLAAGTAAQAHSHNHYNPPSDHCYPPPDHCQPPCYPPPCYPPPYCPPAPSCCYEVQYRQCCQDSWCCYGTYDCYGDACSVMQSLRSQGYEAREVRQR